MGKSFTSSINRQCSAMLNYRRVSLKNFKFRHGKDTLAEIVEANLAGHHFKILSCIDFTGYKIQLSVPNPSGYGSKPWCPLGCTWEFVHPKYDILIGSYPSPSLNHVAIFKKNMVGSTTYLNLTYPIVAIPLAKKQTNTKPDSNLSNTFPIPNSHFSP